MWFVYVLERGLYMAIATCALVALTRPATTMQQYGFASIVIGAVVLAAAVPYPPKRK